VLTTVKSITLAEANPKPIVHTPEQALFEITANRTRTGKSFLMKKGNRRQIITIGHQHYYDGEFWQDVDNTVLSTDRGFECWKTSYFFLAHQTGIGCNYKSRAGGFSRMKLLSVDGYAPEFSKPQPHENCLHYEAIAEDTDFHWQLLPSKVSGWVTLYSDAAPREWKWEFVHSGKVCIARSKMGIDAEGNKLEIECDIDTEKIKPGLYRTILTKRWTGRVITRNKKTRKQEFGLCPVYPVCIDPDISEEITADINDGYESSGAWSYNMNPIKLGYSTGVAYHPGWRFIGACVGRTGDSIDLANFKINQASYYNNGGAGVMYGVDEDSAANFSTTRPSLATKTTATATWSANAGTGQLTENVTAIVSEITGRAGFSSGNNIAVFIITTDSSSNYCTFSYYPDSGNHGRLEIDYTTSGGGGGGGLTINNKVFENSVIRGL
jgi:hypothetical protein